MSDPRSVIHINISNFAVEVERVCDPSLRGRPVIVAPLASARSMVYEMSREAYAEGVRKGMALERARVLCHKAVMLKPRFDLYNRAERAIFARVLDFSPLVEMPDSNGHLFADVTGCRRLLGSPADIAGQISKRLRTELHLCPSWALAGNKLVAKVAVRLVNPGGECVVPPGREAAFLAPLAMHLLPGLRASDSAALCEFQLNLIGQVAKLSKAQLTVVFGRRASWLYEAVRGVDHLPVQPVLRPEAVGRYEHFFVTPVNERSKLEMSLFQLAARAGQGLRRRELAARRVGVFLGYKDGVEVVRQAGNKAGCCYDTQIFTLAKAAFQLAWRRPVGITHLVLCLDRFSKPSPQHSLFSEVEERRQRQKNLFAALDRIHASWGAKSIAFGRGLP